MNILIEAVVKGYHQCPFTVRTGESFVLQEKNRQQRLRNLLITNACSNVSEIIIKGLPMTI